MGIIKDWKLDNGDLPMSRQLYYALKPAVWLNLHHWRKQRADRGWSDRDTWGAGEHIAKVTAEMLQHLNDYAYTDWPEWFKENTKDNRGYKNLQSVIDDINNYLDFQTTSWADDLGVDYNHQPDEADEDGFYSLSHIGWVYKDTGKQLTQKEIRAMLNKHHKQEAKLYEKATKAMEFFGHNFASFWD